MTDDEDGEEEDIVDVCIIGGGWSGLLMGKHCQDQGLTIKILEKGDHLAGVWKYKPDAPGGVMKSTQTTSSWSFTEISDFPLLPEEGLNSDFPRHDVVYAYLNRFAAHHNLRACCCFNVTVADCVKSGKLWRVTDTQGVAYHSRFLTVATGFLQNPRTRGFDDITAQFTGEVRHANTYKHVCQDHIDKNVLVIGGGETASDLCNEVSYVANCVYLSIPNGQWFGGRFNQHWPYATAWPLDMFSSRLRRFIIDGNPRPEKFEAMKVWAEWYDGKHGHGYECWESPYGVYGQAIINKSNDVLRRCVLGAVEPKGRVTGSHGNTVYFADGSAAHVDLIYFATGYSTRFPFLRSIGREHICVSELWKLCMDNQDHTLAFLGFARPIRGSIPSLSESASRFLAMAWAGKVAIPEPCERERMTRSERIERDLFFTAFDKWGYTKVTRDGKPKRANARSRGLTDLFGYTDDLASHCGCRPRYWRLLLQSPRKWLIALAAPHHQCQFLLHDQSKHDHIFNRYRYFLSRFPAAQPLLFSCVFGLVGYWLAWLRNRLLWLLGWLLVSRPHPGSEHRWEVLARLSREQRVLLRPMALKGKWPPLKPHVHDAACSEVDDELVGEKEVGSRAKKD